MSPTPYPQPPADDAAQLLTPAQVIVLGLLRFLGTATPYELKAAVAMSVGNFWTVPHSQLYAEPDRLVSRGLASVEQELGGRRRKSYSVTAAGVAALDAWVSEPPTDLGELRTPALLAVFFGADPAEVAVTQLQLHRVKHAELQRLMEIGEASGPDAPRGPLLTLRAGVMVEETWIAYWTAMLDESV